jgi:hypothetical protein
MGLAGVGDLILTATGDLSRNRKVGQQLAAGKTLDQILADLAMWPKACVARRLSPRWRRAWRGNADHARCLRGAVRGFARRRCGGALAAARRARRMIVGFFSPAHKQPEQCFRRQAILALVASPQPRCVPRRPCR